MTDNSQVRWTEESTGDNTKSRLLLDDQLGSVTRIINSFQDRSELTASEEKDNQQSTTTTTGLQLFQIQRDNSVQAQPALEVHPKHSSLGRSPRASVILPRQLSSSATPANYPILSSSATPANYPIYQRPNPSQSAQPDPAAGETPLYSGTAPANSGAPSANSGAPSANSGAVAANSGAIDPVQAPSAAGAAAASTAGANNPADDQLPPVHLLPNAPASSASAPQPLHSPEPHREPSQANQPVPLAPAPPDSTASVAKSETSSAAPSTATAVTPSQTPDGSSPSPVSHQPFNLSNSSIVVSVPTHVPSANSPPLNAHLSNQTERHSPHQTETSPSGALLIAAIALPIVLVVVAVMSITYRLVKRKRRAHAANRTSYGSQVILADGPQHRMDNMAERKQFSNQLKFPYAMMDDELSSFGVRGDSGYGPPLPPTTLAPPPRLSTTSRVQPYETNTPDPANTTSDSFKGGVACKTNCLVTRTFNPTMSDELKIEIGDRVLVFMLFDDGWCLGENLDFEKHQGSEGFSRTGVLPQDCLSGIQRASVTTSDGAPSFRTAGEDQQEYPAPPDTVPPVPSTASQEILDTGTSASPKPLYKPERNSSLLCDREAQLFLELDHALASTS